MHKCAFCQNYGPILKYFACPGYVYKPNAYTVCAGHKEKSLTWDDVYPYEGCKPVIRHEDKVLTKNN